MKKKCFCKSDAITKTVLRCAPGFFEGHARQSRRRGTTLIETALCLAFVLLPVTLGGLQFGLVLTTTHSLQQISREAGRFAAVHYGESTFDSSETQGDAAGADPSLKNYIKKVAASNSIPWNDIKNNIVVTPASGQRYAGQPIAVSITYPMRKRAIMGSLGFMDARDQAAAEAAAKNNTKGLPGGIKGSSLSLGFLQNDYTTTSTFLME